MCEICSKLTIKTPGQRNWSRSGVFNIDFEQISNIALIFPLLTLNKQIPTRYWLFLNMRLREKSQNTELFLVRIFLLSVRIQENTDQK